MDDIVNKCFAPVYAKLLLTSLANLDLLVKQFKICAVLRKARRICDVILSTSLYNGVVCWTRLFNASFDDMESLNRTRRKVTDVMSLIRRQQQQYEPRPEENFYISYIK